MNVSAHAAGLIRTKNITHHADLYLPVKNIDGTMTIITVEGVYYDPTVNYNVVSVTELANLNFESRFGKHQSSVHAQRECTCHLSILVTSLQSMPPAIQIVLLSLRSAK